MKTLALIAGLTLSAATLQAQAPATQEGAWSLAACISYAQQHNLTVQQKALSAERNAVDLSTARYSRLPDLDASVGYNVSFGRGTSADNTYKTETLQTGSFDVGASVSIFQGLRIHHQIQVGKLDLAAAVQDFERAKEDLSIQITTLYLQVLYNKELVGVAQRQVALSEQELVRSRELATAGKKPESAIYESEALVANDRMTHTQAQNDLQLALLDLSQALNRESAAGFDIVEPQGDVPTLDAIRRLGSAGEIYAYAAEHRPNIKAEQLRVQSAEHNIAIARAARYPSLSLRGGYGTGVYSSMNESFGLQFRNNSREYIGVSLNIPIFNKMATRNNIRTAKISLRSQQLSLTDAERALRKEIEQAWYNASAAYAKYLSASAAVASARIAFEYELERSNAGRSTLFDFNDAKTRLLKSEDETLQAKYEFLIRSKILDYYRGDELAL